MNREQFVAEKHKQVAFSEKNSVSFVYNSIDYTLGRLVYNSASGRYTTSLKWRIDDEEFRVDGIMIQTGVDMVKQFDTRLPSLVAYNKSTQMGEIENLDDLHLYIIVNYRKYFIEV